MIKGKQSTWVSNSWYQSFAPGKSMVHKTCNAYTCGVLILNTNVFQAVPVVYGEFRVCPKLLHKLIGVVVFLMIVGD